MHPSVRHHVLTLCIHGFPGESTTFCTVVRQRGDEQTPYAYLLMRITMR
jgi:hypothetical protein